LIEDPSRIVRRSIALVEEWQSVQTKTENTIPRVKEHWLKPDAEWYTINVGGAFSASENCVGAVMSLFEAIMELPLQGKAIFPHVGDSEGAELLAC
jgi:hypothetical protein